MGESICVRGLAQGVWFRPTVWRLAQDEGITRAICDHAEGVRIWSGPGRESGAIDRFCASLRQRPPPLAPIETIERSLLVWNPPRPRFQIQASRGTEVRAGVVPDPATFVAHVAEVSDPRDRRYCYPFTNRTHCGPRLGILRAIPYERAILNRLDDSVARLATERVAARFHQGLCDAPAELAPQVAADPGVDRVARSGGVFQNRPILEGLRGRLRARV